MKRLTFVRVRCPRVKAVLAEIARNLLQRRLVPNLDADARTVTPIAAETHSTIAIGRAESQLTILIGDLF